MDQKKKNFEIEHEKYNNALTDSQSYVLHKQEVAGGQLESEKELEMENVDSRNREEDARNLEASPKVD